METNMNQKVIALAGNPNVGKSTVFNRLTNMNQHTGNWPGKTVSNAQGSFTYKDTRFIVTDLPGTYSLTVSSAEEEVARDFICSHESDVIVIVADATCLERNLNLVLQILEVTKNVIVCVNLLDEARKKRIHVDLKELSGILGVPVIGTSARSDKTLHALKDEIYRAALAAAGSGLIIPSKENFPAFSSLAEPPIQADNAEKNIYRAKEIYSRCVSTERVNYNSFDRRIDAVVTSKKFGIPIMLLLLGVIFWITIVGANYPSALLSQFFTMVEGKLLIAADAIHLPDFFQGALILGVYKTLTWVIAVMLPPMAIFFPLFTLLEDFGYLPRIAFNMDTFFKKACAHGKQALTMCMGFGCNACGVMGCRIIDSPRERLIAAVTNSFVPCNGRFPTLIAIITMFFVPSITGFSQTILASLLLMSIILLGIALTLLTSRLLSKTILKGIPSSFALELPPYRMPQFGNVIIRSIMDRTLFVLGRAVVVAAPAGLIIWLMANITIGNSSVLAHCTEFLDPFASLIGVDGVILMAFILGFPANEIVVPIIIMSYLATGNIMDLSGLDALKELLTANGWTWVTALCTMLLCLLHFPCGTTCLTLKKETGSWKWTALAFALPTAAGLVICFIIASLAKLAVVLF